MEDPVALLTINRDVCEAPKMDMSGAPTTNEATKKHLSSNHIRHRLTQANAEIILYYIEARCFLLSR